tara:strand:+ start:981 stop:2774 length:1794 start_codon:yes stop_codon:yes gene_type:complete
MSKLFKEAIAEAKQLRHLAEENAKNKIIESMTPKIRHLIEQELMDSVEEDIVDDPDGAGVGDISPMGDLLLADTDTEEVDSMSFDLDDLASSTDNPLVSIQVDGTANIGVGADTGLESESSEGDDDELVELTSESAKALAGILNSSSRGKSSFVLERKIRRLQTRIAKFDRLLRWGNLQGASSSLRESARKHYTQLLKEMISLQGDVIFTEGATDKDIRSGFNRLVKEMRKMSRRHAETLFNRLFEGTDEEIEETGDEQLDELDLVFAEDDLDVLGVEAPEDVDVTTLDVGVEMAGDEEGGEEVDVEEEEEEIDLEELDIILSDEDLGTLGVEDTEDVDVTMLDVGVEMAGEEEGAEEEVEIEDDEELEISESMLRRELRRMRRLREQDEAIDADPALAHGGEDLGDVIVDVDEEDLINALADELGSADVAPTVESRIRRRVASRRRSSRISESRARRAPRRRVANKVNKSRRNRALTGKLLEYKKAVGSLRGQLNEMNLFNAKLLYVNKLMQNRNLSPKQQRAIVEALDNAKTLREAKLLYKSLTSSLNKRSTLKEGAVRRTLGSSSRSTRSAQPSTSGVEVDRWAVLAGINNKNN